MSTRFLSVIKIIIPASLITIYLFASCNHHSSPNATEQLVDRGIIKSQPTASFSIGSGIISPYKSVLDPLNNDLFIVNGHGEIGGQGYLYHLNTNTLATKNTPLEIGINPSDIKWINGLLLVSCRSSSDLYLIDPLSWTIKDRISTLPEPISIAVLGNKALLVSYSSPQVQLVQVQNMSLSIERATILEANSYKAISDTATGKFFINQQNGTVVQLRSDDLLLMQKYITGGTPSFGSAIWNNQLLITDREGYIHNINLQTANINHIDLAISLNVSHDTLPIRGIEPMDIIPLGNNQIAVINSRRDSIILQGNESGDLELTPVALMPAATYGTLKADSNHILLTRPSANKILVVDLSGISMVRFLMTEYITVGVSIKSSSLLDTKTATLLAALDSNYNLHIINKESGKQWIQPPPTGFQWDITVPIQSSNDGNLIAVVNSLTDSTYKVIKIDYQGSLISVVDITIQKPIFTISVSGSKLLAIGRLHGQIEIIDLATGDRAAFTLPTPRPRSGILLSSDNLLVVHDTYPYIGYTYGSPDQHVFTPYTISSWLSDVIQFDQSHLVLSDFDGVIATFNLASKQFDSTYYLPLTDLTALYNEPKIPGFWAVSSSMGKAVHVNLSAKVIDLTIRTPQVNFVHPAPDTNGVWIATDKNLLFFN